ncbi:putative UDP-N-acetylglucosamine transferase subunit ALG14 [Rosellinia necatrix]|uniref:UDP-N-acetylglucosamine transferase subunit ALG14 n=1 Tax=Rosellinia necatrix TaxID=77044 RepID=A0A1W2TC83_ROSNE|nr:putative UDP-N-acetylglucosamine transferase subunit ALG14 [Rosellinia necatrix]
MEGVANSDIKSSEDSQPSHRPSHPLPPTSPHSSSQIHQSTDHQHPSIVHQDPTNHQQQSIVHQDLSDKGNHSKMNTNRDQVIQTLLGDAMMRLMVYIAVLGTAIAIVAITASLMAKLNMRGGAGIMLGLLVVLVVYLAQGANAGMVRGLSTHYVLMICGSGGHTAEMIQMVERSICPEKSSHRRWAVGKDDEKSYNKILAFENRLLSRFSSQSLDIGTFDIVLFGRARYVHQSWLSTPFTATLSLVDIVRILTTPPAQQSIRGSCYPGVIVTNGPGTGFLFLLVVRALKLIRVVPATHMRAIYVESWARVKSLSLTGKLIQRLKVADLFIVQSRFLTGPNEILAENLLVMPQQPQVPFNN